MYQKVQHDAVAVGRLIACLFVTIRHCIFIRIGFECMLRSPASESRCGPGGC
jgi:hypothetical protein